jgi:MazG family protein
MEPSGTELPRLTRLMARLRASDGCPWDRRQTLNDLKVYLIDESYEVLQAIDSGDRQLLCEELGDLLFQIVFVAHLAQEEGAFDMDGVIRSIEAKMIRRHPHVFGNTRASTPQEVLRQWDAIKEQEGKPPRTSALSGIPETLPALYRSYRLGLRAARVGFDWPHMAQLMDKVREELRELEEALSRGDAAQMGEEMGDLLFVLANLSRHMNREPEGLLRRANEKFTRRFRWVEDTLRLQGSSPAEATLQEMERLWAEAKSRERREEDGPSATEENGPAESRGTPDSGSGQPSV